MISISVRTRATQITLFCILMAYKGFVCAAQSTETPTPAVAIMSIEAQGIDEGTIAIYSDTLGYHLSRSGLVDVVDRFQQRSLLGEEGVDIAGCISDECLSEVGRRIGIDLIVVGSIGRVDSITSLNFKIIDARSGSVTTRISEQYSSISELLNRSDRLATKLIQSFSSVNGQARSRSVDVSAFLPQSFSIGISYRVNSWFAVGIWGGFKDRYSLRYIPGDLEIVTGIKVDGGLRTVYGDAANGFGVVVIHSLLAYIDLTHIHLTDHVLPDFVFDDRTRYELLLIPTGLGVNIRNLLIVVFPAVPVLGRGNWYFEIGYTFR